MQPGPPWDVIHCVFSIAIGGQEMVILSLAERADRALFSPRVLCLQGAGELAPRFEAAGIPVDVLDRDNSGALATLVAMRRYLRSRRPAILHTHNPTPHLYGALARLVTDIPVLVHTKHGRGQLLTRRGRHLNRLVGRMTDAVVGVSQDAADMARLVDRLPADRIRVIRNGIDATAFTPTPPTSPGWQVVHIARLNAIKDQTTLLRAARLVLDHHPTFRLELVGDGERRKELEHLTAELGLGNAVRFHGSQADVRPFLAGADAFVLSSVSEGIALTLLEAMAAGLPVVATDVGGNREVVIPGETGFLVPARDPVALARALITLLSDPPRAARFGAAGRARVLTNFALDRAVAAYETLYRRLLERQAPRMKRAPRDNPGITFRRGLIRLYEGGLRRRSVFRYWRELDASQWHPLEHLKAAQFDRLRQFLQQVQATSPWYGAAWRAASLDARDLHQPEDFRHWPMIEKDIIRAHRVAMRTTSPGGSLIAKATGGSSGVPMQFDLDTDSDEQRIAAWHRGYEWAGAAPGTRQWYLWGVAPSSWAPWRKQKAQLYDRLYRRTTVSCFDLSEATMPVFLDSLVRTRPHVIVSYTNAIYEFARMLEARRCIPPAPRSVVVGAEKLHDFQRVTIERVFRAPVFETYGCREFMLIGAECELHSGLHLTMENLYVELVDDAGVPVAPGVEGNVVVTDLTNLGMPFVRYVTGDRAIAGVDPCPCGRGLPLLSKVTGRRLDIITTPDGHILPGEFFPHILKELGSVQRYQVIQERLDTIVVKLVAPGWTPSDEEWFRREVTAVAGTAVRLEIQPVAEIPLTAAGKLQVVVNRLGTPGRTETA